MEQYPENLFKSVATNLLNKTKGKSATQSIAKIAAEYANPKEAERAKFLNQHKFDANVFSGDREAQRIVNERSERMENQVREFYKKQNASGMLDPAQSKATEKKMLQEIANERGTAAQRISIDRTLQAAKSNPDKFNEFKGLSQQSENALGQSHSKEIGATLGAAAGGALGLLGGKKLPKNTKGLLQQVGGAVTGGAIGGVAGGAIGSARDEKRTGFNHEDVMKPYEIATRMNNQQKFK